jgi:hypothetical protein
MNRQVARAAHYAANLSYWMENPEWQSGSKPFDLLCAGVRHLPFSLHEALKRSIFDVNKVLAVSGESVVVAREDDMVDKFMFRYPARLPLGEFKVKVEQEVGVVTRYLAPVALATTVDIKPAQIFRKSSLQLPAVAQTQRRLELPAQPAFDPSSLEEEPRSSRRDKTVRDLEILLGGADILLKNYGYYPDVALNSENLRRNVHDGTLVLTDVMPLYAEGGRLIGDNPPGVPDSSKENLAAFRGIVGQYGA